MLDLLADSTILRDISFVVIVVGQILQSTCDRHYRILRYIKSSPGQGLFFEDQGHTNIVGYSDADWVGLLLTGGPLQVIVVLLEAI